MLSCLVLGATGLVGKELVSQLLLDSNYSPINLLHRRSPGVTDQKVKEYIIDLSQMENQIEAFQVDVVFCCLGTTIKKAGSKETFRSVDFEYPLKAAQLAIKAGAKRFVLVSSLGASSLSNVFYSRVKGEVEEAILKVGFSETIIVRPSILDGGRDESRPGEKLGIIAARAIGPLLRGPLKKYRASKVTEVANIMRSLAKGERITTSIEWLKS